MCLYITFMTTGEKAESEYFLQIRAVSRNQTALFKWKVRCILGCLRIAHLAGLHGVWSCILDLRSLEHMYTCAVETWMFSAHAAALLETLSFPTLFSCIWCGWTQLKVAQPPIFSQIYARHPRAHKSLAAPLSERDEHYAYHTGYRDLHDHVCLVCLAPHITRKPITIWQWGRIFKKICECA